MAGSKPLDDNDRMRYARHLSLPGFGEEAQSRLKAGSVLVVGAGGLGSPVCLYLAAAGVGRIGVMDGDRVDESNLQRQIIHSTAAIGMPKVESAVRRMLELNPRVEAVAYDYRFTADNAAEMLAGYDFVIDATDSLSAKFLINDMCVAAGRPFSHGAIYRYGGHTMTYVPGSACYRCLFESMPDPAEVSGAYRRAARNHRHHSGFGGGQISGRRGPAACRHPAHGRHPDHGHGADCGAAAA